MTLSALRPFPAFDSGFSTFAQGFVAMGSFRLSYITFLRSDCGSVCLGAVE